MKKIEIASLTNGSHIEGTLQVQAAAVRTTKTGKAYLDATLFDGRNVINAKKWDSKMELKAGDIIDIVADVSAYANMLQLTLSSVTISTCHDSTAFTPTRGYNIDAAQEYLVDACMKLPHCFFVFAKELFIDRINEWRKATAAISMHHVQSGGLIQHTAETVMFATDINNPYLSYGVAAPNKLTNDALVFTGALLHDVGKLQTYGINSTSQFIMTDVGRFMEHIAMGIAMVRSSEAAKQFPKIALLLEHIIASHHGQLEYGSTVLPILPEAIIVNKADELSATLDMVAKAYEDTPIENAYTAKIYGLNREFLTATARNAMIDAAQQTLYESEANT